MKSAARCRHRKARRPAFLYRDIHRIAYDAEFVPARPFRSKSGYDFDFGRCGQNGRDAEDNRQGNTIYRFYRFVHSGILQVPGHADLRVRSPI